MLDAFVPDVRHAIRALRMNPGFAAVAILSLALGIGANTAIFTLINAVMLKPLPVHHPEELVQLTMGKPQAQWFSNPIWEQIRERQDVFSGAFAYGRWRFNLAPGGEVRYVQGHYVSGQFFETLGIRPSLGRMLTPSDDQRGCAGAAVLSYRLWRTEYGGRPDILGKAISLNGHPIEVVGVAEPGFTGFDVGSSVGVMVPVCAEKVIRLHPENILDTNSLPAATGIYGWLKVIGRLKPGLSARQATARLKTLAPEIFEATLPRHWSPENQELYLKRTFDTQPTANGQSDLREDYREALGILMAIGGIVLLIACANVANLLLARGVSREREIAIRIALGSGKVRLIRQLLTESLLLSIVGTVLGALFARWGVQLLVRFLDVFLDLTPDTRVFAFNAGVATITGLLVGIAPALRGTRVQPQRAMKSDARGRAYSSGRVSKFGLGNVLVMVQVSMALLLVVTAGLMLSTFWKLSSVNPGFEPKHVLLMKVDFRNGNRARERRVWEMLDRLRTLPGVQSASISSAKPLCDCDWTGEVVIDGYTPKSPDDISVFMEEVSDRYFETIGTAIVAGRDFTTFDTPTSQPVAIINQSMARKFFTATNPLGKYYRTPNGNTLSDPVEIIGIVKDAKFGGLREDSAPAVYTARRQDRWVDSSYEFELRAAGAPTALIAGVKSAILEVDRDAALEFTPLSKRVENSLDREQLLAALSGLFGALALLLTTIGIYGVMSYNVARRRKEIGIRMALGAEPGRVLRMVMGEVALLIGIGLTVGLGAALATTRIVASFLYGLTPNDPMTLSLAVALLAGVASLAGYPQARRAARLEPLTALREE